MKKFENTAGRENKAYKKPSSTSVLCTLSLLVYLQEKKAVFSSNGIEFISAQDLGKSSGGKFYMHFEVVCFEVTCVFFLQMTLIRYWFCIVLVAIGFVAWQSRKPTSTASSTITRKFFHLLALAVYIPGIIYEPYLTHLASSVAVAAFVFIEVGFNLITINYLLTEREVLTGKYQADTLPYFPSDSEVNTARERFEIFRKDWKFEGLMMLYGFLFCNRPVGRIMP